MRHEQRDFSRGVTDAYNRDPASAEKLENFLIKKDKGLKSVGGSQLYDIANPQSLSSVSRIGQIIDFDERLYVQQGPEISYYDNGWNQLDPIGPNSSIANGDSVKPVAFAEWNKHLFASSEGSPVVKIYEDENGDIQARSAGLPKYTVAPTITPDQANGKTYIYYFVFAYSYKVKQIDHIDVSTSLQLKVENAATITGLGDYNQVSNFPTLVNDISYSYDTDNIKIQIYRTIDAGITAYYVGEVANGFAGAFADTVTDADLVNNVVLYSSGNSFENEPPPVASVMTVHNSVGYYGNISGKPNRIVQSIPGDIDSVPSSFYVDLDDDVTGISSVQQNPLAFTSIKTYRLEGVIDVTGAGNISTEIVDDSFGCISHNSIVRGGSNFLYFASESGFCRTDGYIVEKIPPEAYHINDRYAIFTDTDEKRKRIIGTYDRINKRVFWTVQNETDCDEVFIYDETHNSFTTMNGTDFSPTAIGFFNGNMVRGDRRGYIFEHRPENLNNPIIDEVISPASWFFEPVIFRYKSQRLDFGLSDINKWVTRINVGAPSQSTDVDLQINSYDDNINIARPLKEVNAKSGLVWGDPDWVWGDANDVWGIETRFNHTRRFPSGKIRCKEKQVELTNAYTAIRQSYSDDTNSQVTVIATTKTIAFVDSATYDWPEDAQRHVIELGGNTYKVLVRTPDTLQLEDTDGTLVDGQYDFVLRGYKENQEFNINSLIFNYVPFDDSGSYFQGTSS